MTETTPSHVPGYIADNGTTIEYFLGRAAAAQFDARGDATPCMIPVGATIMDAPSEPTHVCSASDPWPCSTVAAAREAAAS